MLIFFRNSVLSGDRLLNGYFYIVSHNICFHYKRIKLCKTHKQQAKTHTHTHAYIYICIYIYIYIRYNMIIYVMST